jgi:hypothetical protein
MTDPGTQRLARAVFALLVLATVAAFFVTQRLKHSPTVVQDLKGYLLFSPASQNGHATVKFSFRIKRADEVTVTIASAAGDDVATLARDHHLAAYTQWALRWNGRTDAGPLAPDGRYQIRVRLRDQGRSVLLPQAITLDTVAPRPLVTRIAAAGAPAAPGPAILPLPAGGPLTIDFTTDGGQRPGLAVYRTDVARPRLVAVLPVAPGATSATWDGTARGRSVGPGVYLVAIRTIDPAGNLGATPAGAADPAHPEALPSTLPPRSASGAVIAGRPGITVRYLGVEPPTGAVDQGAPLVFGVDARRVAYAWSVTRVGAGRPRTQAAGAQPLLRMRPPGGISGAYVLAVRTRTRRTAVPFAVAGAGPERVLVVLPTMTWLGEDPLDDDGDGQANLLGYGDAVRTDRIFAGDGLPAGFADRIAPVLAFADREHLRYDLTTDLALARGGRPGLAGHSGVLLVGDERWLPGAEMARLRAYVRGGGHLASLGVDSLRRTVELDGGVLRDPSGPASTDAFGARLAAVAPASGPVTDYLDRVGLFTGGTGQFTGYAQFEATESIGPEAELVASAVTSDGRPVIVAVRIGRGLVVRTGLPELGARLGSDPAAAALLRRIWALLSS